MPSQCMQLVGFTGTVSKFELKFVYRGSLDDVGTSDICKAEADDKTQEISESEKTLLVYSLA